MITEIIIEMVRMSCLREEYGEFMHLVFGVVIIIVDAIKWPHPVQVLYEENCY